MIRWLGSSHPKFSHSSWASNETSKLKELVGDTPEGDVNWEDVVAKLGVSTRSVGFNVF
jgi:hypothetical protein